MEVSMFFLFPLVALVGTAKLVGGAGNGAAQAIVGGAADNIPPAVISLWGGSVRASVAGGRAYNSLLREIAQAMGWHWCETTHSSAALCRLRSRSLRGPELIQTEGL